MENMKNEVEEGCLVAGNSPEVHETLSLKSASSDDESLRSRTSIKQHLQQYLRSTPCQVLLVGLVIVDTLLVITELMLDLALKDPESPLPFVFHALSLSVMSIFMVEIGLKIYAYQLEFFTHKGDVFDAVVVIVCFCLDAVYLHSHDAHAGAGFMIVLRLWRVVHIQRAIVSQIKSSGDKKLVQEKEKRYRVEQEIERWRTTGCAQEAYIKYLQEILKKNSISYTEYRSPPDSTRQVAVEVTSE
ncbi:voltage-gated hydrogen channel 1-like isoform X2 [Portunus trituberculatus]|uniref:voltage-gated hydrogen channel 1-like isoform X2 n=1 Tax=Portunus trituberculatus TaxID=210409 RepID=UPI001E1CE40C|nr:voltage-gated hydrogen channel 1-like isoform X2 [Portunus trituberculatus]